MMQALRRIGEQTGFAKQLRESESAKSAAVAP